MIVKQLIEVFDILDSADASGLKVKEYLESKGATNVEVVKREKDGKSTDFVKVVIPGSNGRLKGGNAPSLGIIGRLGGIGARPERIGFVSDGDGALTALAAAAKILDMNSKKDFLPGDVYICTHVCPHAPTAPHIPVPFMGSPIDMAVMNEMEVCPEMEAVLSIDTTRGNRLINNNGYAISPTVKEGYILCVSDDLLDIMQIASGELPRTFPITMQDITPYGNGLYHINSILQPCTSTSAPVVGVAITSETIVPGCATGATNMMSLDNAARFAIEVAKAYGAGACKFYDEEEFGLIEQKYGSMRHLQKKER